MQIIMAIISPGTCVQTPNPEPGLAPQILAPSRTAGGQKGDETRAARGCLAGLRAAAAFPGRPEPGAGGRAAEACAGRGVTRPLICMRRADWPRRPPGPEAGPLPLPPQRRQQLVSV